MAQIRNRFDIQNSITEDETTVVKRLPNLFDDIDELKPVSGILISLATHVLIALLLMIFSALYGIVFPHLPKPELPNRDVEFKLVQNESKPPINKNTKIRSDRDSQAGGKHDPKRAISEPSPMASAPKKQAKPMTKPAAPKKTVVQKQPQTKPAPVSKPVVSQTKPVQKPTISKPAAVKPTVKPVYKPSNTVKPSAPKIATAPKSPFTIAAPKSSAPVGSTYKPKGTPSGGSSGGSSGSKSGAPAPKFSSGGSSGGSSRGSSSGSSGSRYASRGSSGGYGSGGNPSPGNPNGAPGIDAIRQPNWGPYMRDLEQRIKRNWSPPKGDSSKRVVITFTIGRDGRLLSKKVTKSSGVPLADRAAMSAIELTAPFRPLPPEFKGQSVPIEFTFDYNVLNSVLR